MCVKNISLFLYHHNIKFTKFSIRSNPEKRLGKESKVHIRN